MMQQAVNNLKKIYYLAVTPGEQGVPEYEFWFVFESCCLYCGCNRELAHVLAPSAGAKVIPHTQNPLCTKNPHESLFGAVLCAVYDDGDEESNYILCFDSGHVIHLYTDYLYSDPTESAYRTLGFYTPLCLSDIDNIDFSTLVAEIRAQGHNVLPFLKPDVPKA